MQALFVAIIILVALAILVPILFMLAALFRAVVATLRPGEQASNAATRREEREGFVDSLAWTLRWSEVANADENESVEGMGGPTPPGGP